MMEHNKPQEDYIACDNIFITYFHPDKIESTPTQNIGYP